jgi:hypothetical protein
MTAQGGDAAILNDPTYGVLDSVGVGAEAGVVLLQGSVNQPWRRDDLTGEWPRCRSARDQERDPRAALRSTTISGCAATLAQDLR